MTRLISSRRVVALVAVVLVALAAVDVKLWREARHDEDLTAARADARAQAETRLPQLLGYSSKSLDADLARANAMTTGDFHDDYARILEEVVAPTAIEQKITTGVRVDGIGVVEADVDRVVVLAFLTQTTISGAGAPVLRGSRVEVTMAQDDGAWLIAGLEPV
jgi:Mce-associated membrane protein